MESIVNEGYIIEKIRQEEIDCIAVVVSSWHYLNALATIDFLRESGFVKKALILACRHGQNGYLIDTKLWKQQDNQLEKYYFQSQSLPHWKEVIKYLDSEVSETRNFYILRSVGPSPELATAFWNAGINRNYISVLIDEGLGYYLRSVKGWLFENRNIDHSLVALSKKMVKEWSYQFYTTLKLKRRKQLQYNTFFERRINGLIVNRTCTDHLKNVLEQTAKLYKYEEYSFYENKLIICTQVFHDLGQIANDADMTVIRQICEQAGQRGVGIVIKPHPREKDLNKYMNLGAEIDRNNRVPLEIILAGLKKKAVGVVGITTTSLITAKVFWGIDTFSIVELINKKNFSSDVMEDIYKFPRVFSQYVTMLKDVHDIFISIN